MTNGWGWKMTNRWKTINNAVNGCCFGDGKHSFELREGNLHYCPGCGMTVIIDPEDNSTDMEKLLKMGSEDRA